MSLGITSSLGLGKSSDYIPYKSTVELGAEKKIAQAKAKINVLSNLDRVNVKFENGFLKRRKARVENYEDFIEELYVKGLRREEIYFALKDLEKICEGELREKIRALRKEVGKKEGLYSKHVKAIAFLGLVASAAVGSYLVYKHLENQRKEEMKKPYKQAGLSDDKIEEFIASYPKQNGNSTWVSFAKSWANDKALAEESLKIFGNLKDSLEYLYFANSNGYDGLNFLKDFPQFAKNYEEVLPAYSANSSLVKIVYDQFQRDPRISSDRNDLFLKGLKEYQDLNLIKKNLMIQTVQALNNLTLAYEQGLPRLDKDSVWLLTNATQISKDIADFSPIVFNSIDGNNYVLEINVSRNTWILTEHLKRIQDSGFEIIKHPEMFEGLNGKVIANAWSLFDAKYGISYAEKEKSGRIIKPNDGDVLDLMMLQWNLYSNKAPQLNGSNKIYNRDFPWYDSNQLKQLYPDKNERRQALFFKFYIPNATFDMEKRERVYGVEGAKLSLTQAEKEYETITYRINHPNEDVPKGYKSWDDLTLTWFANWLADRGNHGLSNTVSQFIGHEYPNNITTMHQFNQIIEDTNINGITQYLKKNWKYWDLVKSIAGYERWNPKVPENEGIGFIIPQTLRAFGFPVNFHIIGPEPIGAGAGEWSVSLPKYVSNGLKNNFPDYKILFGPGNTFGLYAVGDGLEKDGINYVKATDGEGNIFIYLMKNP